jgi:hypothetical protein
MTKENQITSGKEDDTGVATAICQVNLVNQEYHVAVHGWPKALLADSADLLELESRLFRSGAREVILRRHDGYGRFLLAEDSAEFRVQEAPGPQPIRTLRYTLEGWFPYTQ